MLRSVEAVFRSLFVWMPIRGVAVCSCPPGSLPTLWRFKGESRFSPPPPPDDSSPSEGGPTYPEGVSLVHLLAGGMGCFTFLMLFLLVILWHSPLAAQ